MDKPARILVVDDDENIRSTMSTILTDEGYLVDVAATGSEAIRKTEATAYQPCTHRYSSPGYGRS